MSEKQHFATLDGLRGVAAFLVVLLHAFIPLDLSGLTPHAGLAVDFFFCLSGFVVAYAYEDKLRTTMSLSTFALVRMVRLYPLILVGTLLGASVFVAEAVVQHRSFLTFEFLRGLACELLLIPNPFSIGEGWRELPPLDPPAWSLFFELLANAVYGLLVLRLTDRRLTYALSISAFIVVVHAYVAGGVNGGNYWFNFLGGFARISFPFVCGVVLFRRMNGQLWPRHQNRSPLIIMALLVALLMPVPASAAWLYEAVVVLIVFPLIIGVAASDVPNPQLARLYLLLGRLSYPVYILHFPIIKVASYFAKTHAVQGVQMWLLIAAEVVVAIGFSAVMLFVDEPVRAWLNRALRARRGRSVATTAGPVAGDATTVSAFATGLDVASSKAGGMAAG